MKKATSLLIILPFVLPPVCYAITAGEILDNLEYNYKTLDSLSCTISEVVEGSWGEVESNYYIHLRMPNQLRMEATDYSVITLASGGDVYTYYPDDNKAYYHTLEKFQGKAAVEALFNFLRESFNAEYLGLSDNLYKVKLKAKELYFPYQEIYIGATKGFYIKFLNLDDGRGIIINYLVSDLVINPTLSETLFIFDPPADCLFLEGGPIGFQ